VRKLEKQRRREKETLPQRPYHEAQQVFSTLKSQIDLFTPRTQKRLKMIEKKWTKLTAFYTVEGAPANNNLLENYYSTSLKTHRKKALRTDRGIKNHMKLSAMKKANLLKPTGLKLPQIILKFTPFLNTD
jgi:transposase-like protein